MKKVLFTMSFLSLGFGLFAQKFNDTEIFKVQRMIFAEKDQAKNLEDARASLEKMAADPQNAGNNNLDMYRLMTHGRVFIDTALNAKYPDAGDVAYGIFKQQQAAFGSDTAKFNALLKDNNFAGVDGVNNVYVRNFNLALKEFNSQNYAGAYDHFKKSAELSEFLLSNGFSSGDKNGLDTNTVLYTAYAAQNLSVNDPKYADSAAIYYKKLIVDRDIATPEMAAAYQFMIERAIKEKNKEVAQKLLPVAKKNYPDFAANWAKYEMDLLAADANLSDLVNKFNEGDAAGTLDENAYLNFAETLSGKEADELSTDQMIEAKSAGARAYAKLFEKNKDPLYALNAAIVNYQIYYHLEDEFRENAGQGAELKAKRDAIVEKQHKASDESIKWYQTAIPILEAKTDRDRRETNYLRNAYRNMTNIFEWKTNKARGVQPQLVDKYEAEFNKYNKLFEGLSN